MLNILSIKWEPACDTVHFLLSFKCSLLDATWDGHQVYKNHTGLDRYVAYMLGGGYVMSADVVRALMLVKGTIALKHTPIEDATIGMWLTGMDLRAVDHPRCWLPLGFLRARAGF